MREKLPTITIRCTDERHGKRGLLVAVLEKRGNSWRDAPPRNGRVLFTEVYYDMDGEISPAGWPDANQRRRGLKPRGGRREHVIACTACGYGVGATEVHRSFQYGKQLTCTPRKLSAALDAARHAGRSELSLSELFAIIQSLAVQSVRREARKDSKLSH